MSELYITVHIPKDQSYSETYIIGRFTELSARLKRRINITSFTPQNSIYGEMTLFGIPIYIFSVNYNEHGNDRGGLIDDLTKKAKNKRVAPCNRPFNDFTVSFDGTVFPAANYL